MDLLFFQTIMLIVQGLSPIAGLLIILIEVRVKEWYLNFIKVVLPALGIAYCILGLISNPTFPDYWQVLLYGLTVSLFLHLLQRKNPDKNAKVLGIVLIVTHLFSQYWEIPMFIIVHLGLFGYGYGYLGSIDQLYLILVFYLALRFSNISIAKKDLILLSAPIMFSTLAFFFYPVMISYVSTLWFLVRCFSCFCLGKFFVERSVL